MTECHLRDINNGEEAQKDGYLEYTNSCEEAQNSVFDRLPRNSWWLCIRILKAFLSLQGQVSSYYYYYYTYYNIIYYILYIHMLICLYDYKFIFAIYINYLFNIYMSSIYNNNRLV